ncbi:MAG: glycosyl hydrolase [Candidatus Dadabacteria bacterium]
MKARSILLGLVLIASFNIMAQSGFVKQSHGQFFLDGQPYYYIGTNYWYGSVLGLEKNKRRGIERLKQELDFLASKGVKNLRVLAATEGEGFENGVERVRPALQVQKGKFNASVLDGLDVLLSEMTKRNMKAVLFVSNNWEWSGGFLQYLRWNGLIEDSIFRRKLNWDEMRDYVSKFYSCDACKKDYLKQLDFVLARVNKVNGKKYTEDPAIMAWELANEPRPMRPAAIPAYEKWISEVAAHIKERDKNHLVTTGVEGEIAIENMDVFKNIHSDKNIDYSTIHIWPKNWGWFKPATLQSDFPSVLSKTLDYIDKHIEVVKQFNKPVVLEEFGLPRDQHSFDVNAKTTLRDQYYSAIFSRWKESEYNNGLLAGLNFWTFNGTARPIKGQTFWKEGDEYMGDPPMEEQGLNGVFDSDKSTWDLVYSYTSTPAARTGLYKDLPSDRKATTQTIALYQNLKKLLNKGIMFGHQDDMAYGIGWKYQEGRSDVKDLVGDYPAVYGWELGNIEHGLPENLDSVPFDKMKQYIRQGYKRGGVITISWHFDNPLTGESAWDTTHGAVPAILPGGAKHALYKRWLDNVASFISDLKTENGTAIPVLFRPFHEFTGNWFWWCKNTCTPTEFKLLWRFTADYLRNEKNLHNLLLVYNTAQFEGKQEFLDRYPGDDVVDIVSFDSYMFGDPLKDNQFVSIVDQRLSVIEEVAKEKNKIPALAETGYESIPYPQWWTNILWKALQPHKISYVLVWRNYGLQPNGHMHYYAPYKGQVSAADFQKFYNHPKTLFEKDVAKEKLYGAN